MRKWEMIEFIKEKFDEAYDDEKDINEELLSSTKASELKEWVDYLKQLDQEKRGTHEERTETARETRDSIIQEAENDYNTVVDEAETMRDTKIEAAENDYTTKEEELFDEVEEEYKDTYREYLEDLIAPEDEEDSDWEDEDEEDSDHTAY